jgi:hypothetical protein
MSTEPHKQEAKRAHHLAKIKRSTIYDPFREVLSKGIIPPSQQSEYECVKTKGKNNPVNIYIDFGDGPSKTTSLLARVDLGQLGWAALLQRRLGNTQEIWVKGRVPLPNTAIQQTRTNTWPQNGSSGYNLETTELKERAHSCGDLGGGI